MRFVNDTLQAVVLMACDQHAPSILEKLKEHPDGNWFVMPALQACRLGYWNHVSPAHEGHGCAIFGFAERVAMGRILAGLATLNENGSMCADCVAYEWNITPSHIAAEAPDPVCGATVPTGDALSHMHEGQLFLFCSVNCRDKFQKNPAAFLRSTNTRAA